MSAETKATGSLTAIGSGIKSVAHLTLEARAHVESADIVLICSADAVTDAYLRELNPNSEDLHVYYGIDVPRRETYQAMAGRMVEMVRRGMDVVVVFYGHPGVFVDPTFQAINQVREMGLPAVMLPGISAEDCMIADLEIDLITRTARRGDTQIVLTNREFALLEMLAHASPRPVSKAMLVDQVWDHYFDPSSNVVNVYVNYLRKKIDLPDLKPLIHTLRGVGFALKEEAS